MVFETRLFGVASLATAVILIAAQPAVAQTMALPGKFGVSTSGAATYTIPIAVPPGTAGVAPSLSLEYNSYDGDGIMGIGWSLGGLPSITRCPQTFAQDGWRGRVNYDVSDRFCMEGQRLIVVNGGYGGDGTEYRTEIESFSRIISHGSAGNGPAWFEVRSKSGQRMEFGHSTDSLILAQGKTTARVWAVNKVSDTKGNYFTISYTNDATNGQFYPTEIDYTGNSAAGLSPYNKVQFIYATRPDIVPAYQAGSLTRTTVRLTDIKTYTGATLVADYRLVYQQSASTQRSELVSVSSCGGDGACLAATTISWSTGPAGVFGQQQNTLAGGWNFGSPSSSSYTPITGDFNGDGKTDYMLFRDGYQWVFLSNGDGTFAQRVNTLANGWFFQGPPLPYVLITGDFNGDGKTDFILIRNGFQYVFMSFSNDNTFINFSTSQNTLADGWNFGSPVTCCTPIIGDFNGDGKTDYMMIANGNQWVFLSNGDGTFAQRVNTLADGWNFGSPVTAQFLPITGDFNGDGKTDYMMIANGNQWVFLSNGDGTFAQRVNTLTGGWNFGLPVTAVFLPITGDFNGDGKTDYMMIANGNQWVLPSSGPTTDAVLSIANGLGATTSISYQPLTSASVYSKDNTATYPVQDVQAPIYVVSRVDKSNGTAGTYSWTYSYAGAKADLSGRGFLGFRQMAVTDLQTGVVETTTYQQTFPFIGLLGSVTKKSASITLNQATNTYQFSNRSNGPTVSAPSNVSAPYRVSLSQRVETGSDLDGTVLPTTTSNFQYDAYGNATQVAVTTSDGHNKTTNNTYTNDATSWLLGRLTNSAVTAGAIAVGQVCFACAHERCG